MQKGVNCLCDAARGDSTEWRGGKIEKRMMTAWQRMERRQEVRKRLERESCDSIYVCVSVCVRVSDYQAPCIISISAPRWCSEYRIRRAHLARRELLLELAQLKEETGIRLTNETETDRSQHTRACE
jgi:hypothetical protein